jgi:predicted SAM-dependent methyltransferase
MCRFSCTHEDRSVANYRSSENLRLLHQIVKIEKGKLEKTSERVLFYESTAKQIRATGFLYENYTMVKEGYIKSRNRYERINNRIATINNEIVTLQQCLAADPCD